MRGFWGLSDQVNEAGSRLKALQVAGRSRTMLRREKTLILLCAHRAKHTWRSLGWISDLGLERVFRPNVPESQSIVLTQVLFRSYYVLRPLRLLAKRGFGEQ